MYVCLYFKINFVQSKSRKALLLLIFLKGQAVIVVPAFRYSVKSCPGLTALLLKCVFLRKTLSRVFAFLIMFRIRMHTSVYTHGHAHTHSHTQNTIFLRLKACHAPRICKNSCIKYSVAHLSGVPFAVKRVPFVVKKNLV